MMHDEEGLLARKHLSQGGAKMGKTTRFRDQQDAFHPVLSQSMSGIPTGAAAHWMVTKLLTVPNRNRVLLPLLGLIIITLQVNP